MLSSQLKLVISVGKKWEKERNKCKMPSRSSSLGPSNTISTTDTAKLNSIAKDYDYDWNHVQSIKIPDGNQVYPS